jgi:hypothetical protein
MAHCFVATLANIPDIHGAPLRALHHLRCFFVK